MAIRNTTGRTGVLLSAVVLLAPATKATDFLVDGQVLTCATFACSAAGIAVGDPISGVVSVDDAAAAPNSTITEADITGYTISVGNLSAMGDSASSGTSMLMTDASGEIVAGTAQFVSQLDTGFGIADVLLELDAASATWEASTDFLGLGTIATGDLTLTRVPDVDSDGDGVADSLDNCSAVANADQRDSDGDLFGNACDADLDNDLVINVIDLGILRTVFFTADANADFNGDGVVNVTDLGIMRASFFGPPGPSGLAP